MDGLRLILIIIGAVVIALIYLFSRRSGAQQTGGTDPLERDTEWMEEIARQRRRLSGDGQPPSPPAEQPREPRLKVPVLDDVVPEQEPAPEPPHDPAPTAQSEPEPTPEAPDGPAAAPPEPPREEPTQKPQPSPPPAAQQQELVMALHIMAPQGEEFVGATLFSTLEESGLRFGDAGIFHRYRAEDGSDPLFSVANILEPGTFEGKGTEQSFTTPGVAMFMRAPGPAPAREMLEQMLLTARRVARELGGELRDGRRQPLSEAAIQEMLEQASAFDSTAPGSRA